MVTEGRCAIAGDALIDEIGSQDQPFGPPLYEGERPHHGRAVWYCSLRLPPLSPALQLLL
jgi:hypothetical protein